MRIYLLIITIFYSTALFAGEVILHKNFKNINIGSHVEYLEDKDKTLAFSDITADLKNKKLQWIKSKSEGLGFGFTRSAYWIRFTVKNNSDQDREFYLQQEYPLIDYLTFYQPKDGEKFKITETGDYYPFSQRPIKYRNFVFPLKIKPSGTVTYFLRFETTSSMNITLSIKSPQFFSEFKDNETRILWAFYGILLVMIVYNLIIFVTVMDRSYFYYILHILSFLLFVMSLNGTAFQLLWPNSIVLANYNIPFLMSLSAFSFIQFERSFVRVKNYSLIFDKIAIVFSIIIMLAGFSVVFKNYRLSMTLVTAIVGIGLVVIVLLMTPYLAFVKKSRQAIFFFAAFICFIIGVLLMTLKTFGLLPNTFITSYAYQIGSVIEVVLLSLGLADRINIMRKEIQTAEKKYRNLVESADDIIFSLDGNLNFLTVNSAIRKHLRYKEDDVIGTDFLDLIQETWSKKNNIARRIVEEYINDLKISNSIVTFRASFKNRNSHEPKELSVKLEYIKSDNKSYQILGKAYPITDDLVLKFLEDEKQKFKIDNYLSNAELMCQRLTRNLSKYLKQAEVSNIRIALREILINAIEHGNLNIQFEEKTIAMINDKYLEYIQERQEDSRYIDKKVMIEYSLNDESATYKIIDEGGGFNHEEIMNLSSNGIGGEMLPHGRGLILAESTFDMIKFNKQGNEVLLVKFIKN